MTDNFKEIGSLFGREGAGAGFVRNCSGLDIDRILQRPKCLG